METEALNAYAAGLTPSTATVAVTRGLLDRLADDELEAVLAHEMTHIRNYDVRVMVVASIFVGVLGFVSALLWRHATDCRGLARAGNGAGIIAVIVAVAVAAIASFFGTLTRLAISRSREYMADAGAVELTKNPDAMIRALQRIASDDEIADLPEEMQAMMISSRFDGLFSTHPATEDRIAALEAYAGGRRGELAPRPARIGVAQRTPSTAAAAPAAAPAFGRLGMKSGAGPAAPVRPGPPPSAPVRPGAAPAFGRRTARPTQARA
jgi:heat shock protein HtpX